MKKTSCALLLTAGLLAFSSPVMAEPTADAPTPPPADGAGGPPPTGVPNSPDSKARHEKMFMKADKNADGFLTKEEMLESHKEKIDQMFNDSDSDKDGKLSKDEVDKGREVMRAKMKDRWKNRNSQKEGDKSPEGEASGKVGAP